MLEGGEELSEKVVETPNLIAMSVPKDDPKVQYIELEPCQGVYEEAPTCDRTTDDGVEGPEKRRESSSHHGSQTHSTEPNWEHYRGIEVNEEMAEEILRKAMEKMIENMAEKVVKEETSPNVLQGELRIRSHEEYRFVNDFSKAWAQVVEDEAVLKTHEAKSDSPDYRSITGGKLSDEECNGADAPKRPDFSEAHLEMEKPVEGDLSIEEDTEVQVVEQDIRLHDEREEQVEGLKDIEIEEDLEWKKNQNGEVLHIPIEIEQLEELE